MKKKLYYFAVYVLTELYRRTEVSVVHEMMIYMLLYVFRTQV